MRSQIMSSLSVSGLGKESQKKTPFLLGIVVGVFSGILSPMLKFQDRVMYVFDW